MATYNKALRTTKVTTLMDYEGTASDTVSTYEGKVTWEAFKAKKTMQFKGEQNTVIVPFHAVKKAETSLSTAEATKADAYCEQE